MGSVKRERRKTARILIVDDHPLVRERLRELIEREPDLTVCGEAADHHSTLQLADTNQPDFVLLDEDGSVGKAFGAKTTPQMALIDQAGVLRYQGAIDDKPSTNHATVPGAVNYLLAALASVNAGKPVAIKETKPYGCSVKYRS